MSVSFAPDEIFRCSHNDRPGADPIVQQMDDLYGIPPEQRIHLPESLRQQGQAGHALPWQMPDDEKNGRRGKAGYQYPCPGQDKDRCPGLIVLQ